MSKPNRVEQTNQKTAHLIPTLEWKIVKRIPLEVKPMSLAKKRNLGDFSSDMIFEGFKAGGSCSEQKSVVGSTSKFLSDEQKGLSRGP